MFRVRRRSGGEDFSLTPTLPEDKAKEMMEHQLMTAQIRVHNLNLSELCLDEDATRTAKGGSNI